MVDIYIENPPLVSVIMPAYNVEKYVASAIESVLNQTYSNWELIIINDGSTDGTLNILKDYEKKDRRISVYSQENQMLGPSRNNGFKLAKGDYVYFMDSDDLLHSDLLFICLFIMGSNDLDILNFKIMNFSDESLLCPEKYSIEKINVEFICNRRALISLPPTAPAYLYKASLLRKAGINYPPIFHEDEVGTYPFFCFANKIGAIDIPLYFYRKGIQSITSKKMEVRYPHYIKMLSLIIEQSKIYPEYKDEFVYRAIYFIKDFRTVWNGIDETWVKNGLEEVDVLELSILPQIKDNPYFSVENKIINICESSLVWKAGSIVRTIYNIMRFKKR